MDESTNKHNAKIKVEAVNPNAKTLSLRSDATIMLLPAFVKAMKANAFGKYFLAYAYLKCWEGQFQSRCRT
jgi:hypothetical protein